MTYRRGVGDLIGLAVVFALLLMMAFAASLDDLTRPWFAPSPPVPVTCHLVAVDRPLDCHPANQEGRP
jgi:hypothetical protein